MKATAASGAQLIVSIGMSMSLLSGTASTSQLERALSDLAAGEAEIAERKAFLEAQLNKRREGAKP